MSRLYSSLISSSILTLHRGSGMPAMRSLNATSNKTFGVRWFHASSPSRNLVKVEVNGQEVQVAPGITVLQACEEAGVHVPRFCYHERLSIAGNCRMCLVEVEKSPKPIASCAMPIMPGMKIKTETPKVKKAREGVIEFLLANHPLDCPICDQGGECDLQDQSMLFGSDRSRFREWKRTVEDKNLGPLVKTVMTRCIHCTRCVRFAAEVAGVPVLGATGRGQNMEIGTYVEHVFDSEISGNVIDLCPVGALTSKPFAFTARPWELGHVESIDIMDAVGANIRIDTRGPEILRVLPRLNEEVNEEWLGDKGRFSYDGLKRQRLDTCYQRKGTEVTPISWRDAFETIQGKLKGITGSQMAAVAGPFADLESLVVLKDLMNRLGCENLRSSEDLGFSADLRSDYVAAPIAGIEESDLVLLVGTNPRMEAPLIAARIRKSALHYGLKVASIGPQMDLALPSPHEHLGNKIDILSEIAAGTHPFAKKLEKAKRPLIIVGMSALQKGAAGVRKLLSSLSTKFPQLNQTSERNWQGISFLHTSASRVGQLDVGFVPGAGAGVKAEKPFENAKFVYLLGVDDERLLASIPEDAFVVYQGHHGDNGASRANIVLPGPAYTEKTALYVNLEGRVQQTLPATGPVGEARDDWRIIRALSEVLGVTLPYSDFDGVRARVQDIVPFSGRHDRIESPSYKKGFIPDAPAPKGDLEPLFDNYFLTDPISRASRVMAKCSAQLPRARNSYVKA